MDAVKLLAAAVACLQTDELQAESHVAGGIATVVCQPGGDLNRLPIGIGGKSAGQPIVLAPTWPVLVGKLDADTSRRKVQHFAPLRRCFGGLAAGLLDPELYRDKASAGYLCTLIETALQFLYIIGPGDPQRGDLPVLAAELDLTDHRRIKYALAAAASERYADALP